MKNLRYRPLIIVSGLLLLLSLGVMGNWAYRAFFKPAEPYTGELIVLKPVNGLQTDTEADKEGTHDPGKMTKPGKKHHTDIEITGTGQQQIDYPSGEKTQPVAVSDAAGVEINRLKTEIELLLKNKSSDSELKLANQKIDELEQKINRLSDANSDVEKENARLLAVLKKLSDNRLIQDQSAKTWPVVYEDKSRVNRQETAPALPAKQSDGKNDKAEPLAGNNNTKTAIPVSSGKSAAASLTVESMNLLALTITDNKELETHQAFLTDKFVGELKINRNSFTERTGELYIVIMQPDGKVLQKSTWESGTFHSPEGKKVYSCRLRFDITSAETQKLVFSINAPNFFKGKYIMQVYDKKGLITSIAKSLL